MTPILMSWNGSVSAPWTGSSTGAAPIFVPQRASVSHIGAAAHRLGAAGQRRLDVAGLDRLAGRDDRLHARCRTGG